MKARGEGIITIKHVLESSPPEKKEEKKYSPSKAQMEGPWTVGW